jgi:hypothetical protein
MNPAFTPWLAPYSAALFRNVGNTPANPLFSVVPTLEHAATLAMDEESRLAIEAYQKHVGYSIMVMNYDLYYTREEERETTNDAFTKLCSHASMRLPVAFDPDERRALATMTHDLLFYCWLEHIWNVEPHLRLMNRHSATFLAGHLICGWGPCRFPEGEWFMY